MDESATKKVVIIGGGPAGLTAAYELCNRGIESIVLEKDSLVGGLARTVDYKGYHFDIGGHRFFTKVRAVEKMWHEVLQSDFLYRGRLSRIYYNHKFFYYPLRAWNALLGLGLFNSLLIVTSYLWARLFPDPKNDTFEQWVSNRFGKRLYRIFFQTYTEKVWGIPCSEIRAEWAAQRIKGLSLMTVLKNTLLKQQNQKKGDVIKSLIDAFHYPRYGPGMMWQRVAGIVRQKGGTIRLNSDVEKVLWDKTGIQSVEVQNDGMKEIIPGTHFISTMPIRELIHKLSPEAPEEVLQAASSLNYRDFITVALIVNRKEVFPDNWIYIHDPQVKVGRIQNFKNWSPEMVPDPEKTCLGLEYFCFEGDGLWNTPDAGLVGLAKRELEILGLCAQGDVEDGTVVRMPKAYPVYDSTYKQSLQLIQNFLEPLNNLQLVGRNGMHKYNNQDHSMLTAMLAVRNIEGEDYDLWAVNADPDYHEEMTGSEAEDEFAMLASKQPMVPERFIPALDRAVLKSLARMDKLAFATAIGTVSGLCVFLATIWIIVKGPGDDGPTLWLLSQYFIGYTLTAKGAFVGLGYSFFWGFFFGWLFAYLRNLVIGIFLYYVKKEAEASSFKNLLDYI
jgi:protoporphyrinogen oxidase